MKKTNLLSLSTVVLATLSLANSQILGTSEKIASANTPYSHTYRYLQDITVAEEGKCDPFDVVNETEPFSSDNIDEKTANIPYHNDPPLGNTYTGKAKKRQKGKRHVKKYNHSHQKRHSRPTHRQNMQGNRPSALSLTINDEQTRFDRMLRNSLRRNPDMLNEHIRNNPEVINEYFEKNPKLLENMVNKNPTIAKVVADQAKKILMSDEEFKKKYRKRLIQYMAIDLVASGVTGFVLGAGVHVLVFHTTSKIGVALCICGGPVGCIIGGSIFVIMGIVGGVITWKKLKKMKEEHKALKMSLDSDFFENVKKNYRKKATSM
ncbi:MAG: hypothetical protein AAF335_00210 [Bacteroidota bacterium]